MTDCLTCELTRRRDAGTAPLWDNIYRIEHWDVAHAYNTSLPGWLVLIARFHRAAIADLSAGEAAELGPLLRRVSMALQAATGCEKTYVVQFAEAAGHGHVHFHVVPRMADLPNDYRGPDIFKYLGVSEAERVSEAAMNKIGLAVRRQLTDMENVTPIEELDLYTRHYNSIRRAEISTVGELIALFRRGREGIQLRNYLEEYLLEAVDALKAIGCWPDDMPDGLDLPTIEDRFQWLLRTQTENGSWADDLDRTAAALLCLIRAGHTSISGDHQSMVRRGMEWLSEHQSEVDGDLAYAVQRVFAEEAGSEIDLPPFVRTMRKPIRAESLQSLRQRALIVGCVTRTTIYGGIYSHSEIAWMAVGKPKGVGGG